MKEDDIDKLKSHIFECDKIYGRFGMNIKVTDDDVLKFTLLDLKQLSRILRDTIRVVIKEELKQ